MAKIIITGGSGFMGKALYSLFKKDGNQVIIISRNKPEWVDVSDFATWDGRTTGAWTIHLEGASAIINLAGKSVDCRYTDKNKSLIMSSRINATKAVAAAIQLCTTPPTIWLNAASATIYRHAEDHYQTESAGEIQNDFSVQVCKAWEQAFFESNAKVRKVALRISIVLGDGSALKPLKILTKLGMGGPMGKGTQRFSWVHIEDVYKSIRFIIDSTLEGPVNIVSPNAITNKAMMKAMRKNIGIQFGIPQPEWLLKFGAMLIGTEAELILKSRWVYPERLLDAGFQFKYTNIDGALASLN
ncbi:MAG: TIGR01777 family oxidoreductase [Bacteroidota bacterium]